jgi:hypothetical protein
LQGSSIGSCGSNNNGVFKCFTLTEKTHDVGDSGPFLADGDVDAVKGLGAVASIVASLLVENSVDGNRSFSGLSVANDKFTLATTDWDL